MGFIRKLYESRPWHLLRPDDSVLVDANFQGGGKTRAALAEDGSFAFVYTARGQAFSVRMDSIRADEVNATWFDPRYGIPFFIHKSGNQGVQTFTPPTQGRGCDWVLVLDDAGKDFPQPGLISR